MKKISAPGRRASTKRAAFKADGDQLVEEISATPAVKLEVNTDEEDTARHKQEDKAEVKPLATAEREALKAEKKRLEASEAKRRQEEMMRLDEEEDRKFAEEEARRAAEDAAELEKLKQEVAERERARREVLEAAERERLRILAELDQEDVEAKKREEVATAARALAEAQARDEELQHQREVKEAAENARLQALETEAIAKAAKEAEWRRLMEEEEVLLQREREEKAAAEVREARLAAERAERLRLEEEALSAQRERNRIEKERLEAEEQERIERERQEAIAAAKRLEEEAVLAATKAEEELRRKQTELEERRLAVIAREEAEAAEQRRKLEDARKKRQSFLSDNDAFSANLENQYQEKDEKLQAVKNREADILGGEIKLSGENFKAQVPTKRIVEEEPLVVAAAPVIPTPEPAARQRVDEPKPEPVIKNSAAANANFSALTSSLFGDTDKNKEETPEAAPEPNPATVGGSVGLFGEDTAATLFSNRTFATKKEKKSSVKADPSSSVGAGAAAASSGATDDDDEVDWDAIESEGKQDDLSGHMAAQWKARQIDLTTRRNEFRGAVCYGLGGIFAWQMYSAAESRDEFGKSYTEYLMRCQWGTKWDNMQPWLVARRYREFDFLDSTIRKEFPSLKDQLIPLPGKAIMTFGQVSVPERTRGIEDYMINILNTVPQVLKSSHMYIFLDLTERIEGIKKKIKETERNGGVAPVPDNLPAPGSKKELGKATAAPATMTPTVVKSQPTFASTKSSGDAGFGPDGLNSSLVAPVRVKKEPEAEGATSVEPLQISELYDEATADAVRRRENSRMLDDDSLGVLEENIRDLITIARRTKPADVQKSPRLVRALRLCQSQWPSLRATCAIDPDPLSSTSMLVPRAMQAEEDLDRVVKEIKSVLMAQSIGSPLHF